VGADRVSLAEEHLAAALGASPASLRRALAHLRRSQLAEARDDGIVVLDRPALEAASCSCYHAIIAVVDRQLG
jgi:DNA-binding GntR family transcriptional regulator